MILFLNTLFNWLKNLFIKKEEERKRSDQWETLRENAIRDAENLGKNELPPSDSINPCETELVIKNYANDTSKLIDSIYTKEKEILISRLSSFTPSTIITELKIEAKNAVTDFSASINTFIQKAILDKREYHGIEIELERFKKENKLYRDPHYPDSPLMNWAILLSILLFEIISNAYFFMAGHPAGFLGAFLQSLLISFCSMCLVFPTAFFIRQLFHNSIARKAVFIPLTLLACVIIISFNLCVAHLRDILINNPIGLGGLGNNIIVDRISNGIFNLDSPESYLIFMVLTGLTIIAIIDIFKMDDPYPNFGKLHRLLKESDTKWNEICEIKEKELTDNKENFRNIILELSRKIDQKFLMQQEMITSLHLKYQKYYNDIKLNENIANDLLDIFRRTNTKNRKTEPPDYFTIDRYNHKLLLEVVEGSYIETIDSNKLKNEFSEIRENAIEEINQAYRTAMSHLQKNKTSLNV
jgi:hypothetical protein